MACSNFSIAAIKIPLVLRSFSFVCFFKCIQFSAFALSVLLWIERTANATDLGERLKDWKISLSNVSGFHLMKEKAGKNSLYASDNEGRELRIVRRYPVSPEVAQKFAQDQIREVLSMSEAHFQGYFQIGRAHV